MTHKTKNAEFVDTLINNLPENQVLPHEEEGNMLITTPHNGKDHFPDLQAAITEKDIMHLRDQLGEILTSGHSRDGHGEPLFELAEKGLNPELLNNWENMDFEALLSGKPLPRIHIHLHQRANSENMHRFYEEQIKSVHGVQDYETGLETDDEFPLLEEALGESDIIDLRETLKQISGSSSFYSMNVEEIDNYLDGNMTHTELETFENELDINPELNRNVELYAELNEALQENDIIDIREKLGKVIQSQHSSTWSLEEVDAFVNGEMPENEREAFIAEMADNDDLRAEVNLSKSLNKAFEEKDIHHLRKELEIIAQEMKQLSANSLIMLPDKHRKMRRNGTYAAVVIALIGLSSVFWQNDNSSKSRYDEFFKMPQTVSSLRSVGTIYNEVMSKGFELYNKSEYVSALPYFEKVLQTDKTNPIAHYWAGLTNRQMQRYPDALLHFQQVINHHNNLCVEQAEWFSILCMIKMSRVASVISPLNAIIDRKGYYYKEALTLRSKILKND